MLARLTSLLAGRNKAPLSEEEVLRAANTFLGMDPNVNALYDPASPTLFRVDRDNGGHEYGEIVFGPDIYPGHGLVDPNSLLSLTAAVAHELTHFYRWRDKATLADPALRHLDEAFTSMQAALRYEGHLNQTDIRQLIADALQRLRLYHDSLNVPPER
jgi:hypothetical protein